MSATLPMGEPSPAPDNYPFETIEKATLRDGTTVTIRPIRPDDAPRLQEGFRRLSSQSIFLRFLETFKELSDKQAEYFANVDYQQRMALVASIPENGRERLIGVARYAIATPDEPGVAESAIVVADEYQGLGLGTILLERLVKYARSKNVRIFVATVHYSNTRILRFVQRSGLAASKKMIEPGVWEVRIEINRRDPTNS